MKHSPLLLALLVCSVTGCANARYVMRNSDFGVVAIPASTEAHREKAHELMAQHFPKGYVIEQEQEEVVGTTTNFRHHDDKLAGATTKDKTEWRIHYRRRMPDDGPAADFGNELIQTARSSPEP